MERHLNLPLDPCPADAFLAKARLLREQNFGRELQVPGPEAIGSICVNLLQAGPGTGPETA